MANLTIAHSATGAWVHISAECLDFLSCVACLCPVLDG